MMMNLGKKRGYEKEAANNMWETALLINKPFLVRTDIISLKPS